MIIILYKAKKKAEDMWVAHINRLAKETIRKSTKCLRSDVLYQIYVYGDVTFDSSNSTLKFNSEDSEFVNIGMSIVEDVLVKRCTTGLRNTVRPLQNYLSQNYVNADFKQSTEYINCNSIQNYLFSNSGDAKFVQKLERLNDYHKKVGLELIARIRNFNPHGKLKYFERSNTFVEQPDNFWAIQIHPQSESFSITIRGKLIKKSKGTTMELKHDRPGYIRFSISRLDQISEAILLIEEAKWNQ